MANTSIDDLLTSKQVIEILKIDRTTLYRMLREGRIKGIRLGGQWRFSRKEVQSHLLPTVVGDKSSESSTCELPLHCLQPIQEVFSDIIQVAAVTTDADGIPFSQFSNPCQFCELIMSSDKGKAACINSWKNIQTTNSEVTVLATCHAGLNYAGADIVMDGKRIARLIVGQFFDRPYKESEKEKKVLELAKKYKIEYSKLLAASDAIPVMDERIMQFLGKWLQKVAKAFATLGFERKELLQRLQNIAEISKL
ncbi:MAG: PocR ligand-binding domain-containing protein [Ignavibacteria bacterium]|nr:PocR ligand-binding domain-containing protein [Ignavibacteria bacterium]